MSTVEDIDDGVCVGRESAQGMTFSRNSHTKIKFSRNSHTVKLSHNLQKLWKKCLLHDWSLTQCSHKKDPAKILFTIINIEDIDYI